MTMMNRRQITLMLLPLLVCLIPGDGVRADLASRAGFTAQEGDTGTKAKKSDKQKNKDKKDKKATDDEGVPTKLTRDEGRDVRNVMWQEQTDIPSLDLYYGPGGREGSPETATKFTFVSRD